jgi:hypothetical protein
MALLQHPGMSLTTFGEAPPQLVMFMAKQIGVPNEKYADYAKRVQILSAPLVLTPRRRRRSITGISVNWRAKDAYCPRICSHIITPSRRRATLAALMIELETRLIDAARKNRCDQSTLG